MSSFDFGNQFLYHAMKIVFNFKKDIKKFGFCVALILVSINKKNLNCDEIQNLFASIFHRRRVFTFRNVYTN